MARILPYWRAFVWAASIAAAGSGPGAQAVLSRTLSRRRNSRLTEPRTRAGHVGGPRYAVPAMPGILEGKWVRMAARRLLESVVAISSTTPTMNFHSPDSDIEGASLMPVLRAIVDSRS